MLGMFFWDTVYIKIKQQINLKPKWLQDYHRSNW